MARLWGVVSAVRRVVQDTNTASRAMFEIQQDFSVTAPRFSRELHWAPGPGGWRLHGEYLPETTRPSPPR